MSSKSPVFVEALAVLLALTHVATVAALLLWIGVGKPRNRKEFWIRFKREFLSFTPR